MSEHARERARGAGLRRPWVPTASAAALVAIAVAALVLFRSGPVDTTQGEDDRRVTVAYTTWDGRRTTTASFAGRPLVVNFWASWCTSCLAEIPRFVEVYERHRARVAFLGLNLQDDPDAARRLARRLGITYALGRDPHGEAFRAFGAVTMPTTVLVDTDGSVVRRLDGEVSAETLEHELARLLGDGG